MTDTDDTILYQNMRAMISLVDKLRDFNLNDYISLPRIAVLGEQSAGKSSLLESVCGLNFLPRGSGIVTRRPLELRMVRSSVSTPYFVFPKDYKEKKFTDPNEVRGIIEKLTDKGAGGSKNISDIPIVCTVYSPVVPDLTLIDLPGITRNPTADQPANIEEITKGLVRKYCEDVNTLILIVIPANIDLSTSDALSFARKLDPKGQRSLGVITKVDLMDEGTDARSVLNNEEIKLKYGYVGIKGRSQAEVKRNLGVDEAIQNELDFFGKHPIYSTMPTNLLGTRSMVDRTSAILYDMIKTSLPKIQKEIMERKKNCKSQLSKMGEEFPETEERKMELVFKLIRNFKDNFDQEIKGKYFHQQILTSKQKNIGRGSETITFLLNSAFADLYEEFSDKEYRVAKDYSDEYIRNAIDVYQGESIPGFHSFDSFLYLIHPKLDMLKQPVFSLLDDCKNILENRGGEIIDRIFKKFHTLHSEIKETFNRVLVSFKNKARKILENLLKNEENYLFTNDSIILSGQIIDAKDKVKFNASDILVLELRARIDKYFHIVVRNMRDVVPKIIGQFLIKKFNETLEVEILNALSYKDYCLSSLNEDKNLMSLRSKLKVEMEALVRAENLLVNEFNMGFDLAEEIDVQKSSVGRGDTLTFDDNEGLDEDLLMDIDMINDEYLEFNNQLLQNFSTRIVKTTGNNTTLKTPNNRPQNNTRLNDQGLNGTTKSPRYNNNQEQNKRKQPPPFKIQVPQEKEAPKNPPSNQQQQRQLNQQQQRTPSTQQQRTPSNQQQRTPSNQQQQRQSNQQQQYRQSQQQQKNNNQPSHNQYRNQQQTNQVNNKRAKAGIFGESNKNLKVKNSDPFDTPLISGRKLISNEDANNAFEQFNKIENKEKLAKDTYKVGKTVGKEVKKSPFLQKQAKKGFGNLFG